MKNGARKEVNSGSKLQRLMNQFDKTMDLILNEAGNPEFAASIAQLKVKMESIDAKKNKSNKDTREVSKQLQKYPGLSKHVLSMVKAKIAEYKKLGVIEKYQEELATTEK